MHFPPISHPFPLLLLGKAAAVVYSRQKHIAMRSGESKIERCVREAWEIVERMREKF